MSTYTPHLLIILVLSIRGLSYKYFNVPHSSRRNSNPLHKAYRVFALCLALHPPLLIASSLSPFVPSGLLTRRLAAWTFTCLLLQLFHCQWWWVLNAWILSLSLTASQKCYDYSHFTDEKTKPDKLKNPEQSHTAIKWRRRVEAEWSHPRAQSRLSLPHPRLWTKPGKCLVI